MKKLQLLSTMLPLEFTTGEGVAKIEKTLTERVVLWMYWLQAFRIDNIAKKFNKFLVSF